MSESLDWMDAAIDEVVRGLVAGEPPRALRRSISVRLEAHRTARSVRRWAIGAAFAMAAVVCAIVIWPGSARPVPRLSSTPPIVEMASLPAARGTNMVTRDLATDHELVPSRGKARTMAATRAARVGAISAAPGNGAITLSITALGPLAPITPAPLDALEPVGPDPISVAPLTLEPILIAPLGASETHEGEPR